MAYWLTHGTDNRHALSHSIQAVAAGQWFTRWLRRHPDLTSQNTIFYTFRLSPLTSGLALASRKLHLRIVSRAHTDDLRRGNRQLRLFTARHCKAIFTTSDQTADVIRRRLSGDRHVHIETRRFGCVDLSAIAPPSPHIIHNQLTFLTVGPITEEKRFSQMAEYIDALATARETPIKWIVVGDGLVLRRPESHPRAAHPNKWLTTELLGAVNNDDVHALYAISSIDWTLLLADDGIGCPVALCESMMYECFGHSQRCRRSVGDGRRRLRHTAGRQS